MATTTKPQTNDTLRNDMWRACDILRRDNNVGGIMQYTEHLAWLLFLKFLDEEEKRRTEEEALTGESYTPLLSGDLAWETWTALPANEIVQFVRGRLLPGLAGLQGTPLARTVAGIFSDEHVGDQTVTRNLPVCASGYNLKDVLDIIDTIRFDSAGDIFTITQFYEDLLFKMGNENRIAGARRRLRMPRLAPWARCFRFQVRHAFSAASSALTTRLSSCLLRTIGLDGSLGDR